LTFVPLEEPETSSTGLVWRHISQPSVAHPPGRASIVGHDGIAGSLIGGIAETQQMLDFCSEHNTWPNVEIIPIQAINEAHERIARAKSNTAS
jgi:D-arabinose 1-dehydrogenase-like Zn-dependent alcohol dehydrogenase